MCWRKGEDGRTKSFIEPFLPTKRAVSLHFWKHLSHTSCTSYDIDKREQMFGTFVYILIMIKQERSPIS
jgi:hypothetical protein